MLNQEKEISEARSIIEKYNVQVNQIEKYANERLSQIEQEKIIHE